MVVNFLITTSRPTRWNIEILADFQSTESFLKSWNSGRVACIGLKNAEKPCVFNRNVSLDYRQA